MDYPYTTIFGRGFTNKFEVTIKQSKIRRGYLEGVVVKNGA